MRFISLTSFALAASSLLMSGCSVPTTTSGLPGPSVTGNWLFIPIDDFFHNDKLGDLVGSLSNQDNSITGILRSSGGCVSPTQDISFSGTEDAKGNLTLTSTNLPDNLATITGTVQTFSASSDIESTLTVTGTGPCTMPPYLNFSGTEIPPLNGSYSANLTSTAGATSTLTANLTAAAANSDGQFPETGTLTLTASSCSTTFSLNGVMTGDSLQGTLTPASGPANGATFSYSAAQVTLSNPGTGCAAGTFTGTLLAK
jgi:hypothetical protein